MTEETLRPVPFWYLRHGETDWNAKDLSQGRVEVPLNANGIAQARQAAALLVGRGIASIVCSPLGRAQETARIVAEALALPIETEQDLQEVSFGEQEGLPMGDWYDDWIAGDMTPPGAEPFAALRARAVAAINRAQTRTAPVLVVAHGAFFRAVRSAMGLVPNIRTPNGVPLYCVPGTPWVLEEAQP
jgi:probable phosphoglycerate mutase